MKENSSIIMEIIENHDKKTSLVRYGGFSNPISGQEIKCSTG